MTSGVSDYILVVEYGCFCVPERRGPFEIAVKNGEVVEVSFDGAVIEPQPGMTPVEAFTVVGLFGEIRSRLDADEITVQYGERGNPTRIEIDQVLDVVDDELTITAVLTVVNESPSTTTSGFAGPTDTNPPPFGPSLQLPLVDGYGVLCSGASAVDGFWYAALEGPFAQPELGGFEPIAAAYESFLEDAGFEVTKPVDSFGEMQLAGVGVEAVVSVTIGNTMSSNLVVAAWAVEPGGFVAVAESAAEDSRCYGVVEGMIAPDEAPAQDSEEQDLEGLECETLGMLEEIAFQGYPSAQQAVDQSGASGIGVVRLADENGDVSVWLIEAEGRPVGVIIVDRFTDGFTVVEYEVCVDAA
jgi:hypothetical protein